MNYQTKEKITNIRTAIENKETREDIDKSYFKTKTIKKTFLSRNKSYFDKEELLYLGYDPETDTLLEKTSDLTKLETANNGTSNQLTELEMNFFKESENLKILIEIVRKYKSQSEAVEIIENGIVNIPTEAKLKLDRNLAVKTNGELYDKIVDLAYKNKVGKGEFVTYILWEFLKKHS